jgi:phloretin hydrolase
LDPIRALTIEDRTELIKPGNIEPDTGYCLTANGTGYVTNRTFMPDTTIEMVYRWYVWHSLEVTRYKLWDPVDHINITNLDPKMSADQSIPLFERLCRQVHLSEEYMTEYMEAFQPAKISFKRPSELEFDES